MHASSLKKGIKKRVIENNILHGALLLLERMFQGSKKFIQLFLKPKSPIENIRERIIKYEEFESLKECASQSVKKYVEL